MYSLKKRILAVLLCAVMVFGLAACGKTEESSPEPEAPATSAGESKDGALEETKEEAKDEATLTAFIQQSVTSESGVWQGWGAQRLLEDLNLKIDFYPTGNEVEQKLKQYLAAGDLPDFIGFKGLDQAQLAMDANMLLNLDDYKEQLPSMYENDLYEHAIQYSRDFTSNDTGDLYIMPSAVGPVSFNAYNWVPQLQWDAYKNIGAPEIGTLEDYLDVVEKMVEYKPTTPEGEKVYGFSLFSDWDKYTALEVSTLSFFYGIDTEYVSHLTETNVMTEEINSLLDDNSFYKRALQFYFDANQRGLLDPDSMTQTFSNVDSKYSAGRVMFSHFSWMTGSYNSPASGHVNNEDAPDGYVQVVADDMKLYEAPDQNIGRNWYFAISKDSKQPERAAELLNWIYDGEVAAYLSNGPEGLTWEFDADGKPYITEEGWELIDNKADPLMPEDIGGGAFQDGSYSFNTLGPQASVVLDNGYTLSYRYWPDTTSRNMTLVRQENNELMTERLGSEVSILHDYLDGNDMIAKSTQAVNMIPTASDELEMTLSQIGEVVKKLSWQMIYASDQAEFDTLWEQMQTEADGLGMQEVFAHYEQAWKDALSIADQYE